MSELTPEEEAEVAALLADAGGSLTMPDHVVARLDDVLAGLVAEQEPSPVVVPFKRRRWPQVLMAAAAVSVFGYAGTQLLGGQSGDSADKTAAVAEGAGNQSGAPSMASRTPRGTVHEPDSPLPDFGPAVTDSLKGESDLRTVGKALANVPAPTPLESQRGYTASGKAGCHAPVLRKGTSAYQVAAGKRLFVVVLHRVGGSATRADVYPCRESLFPVSSVLLLGR